MTARTTGQAIPSVGLAAYITAFEDLLRVQAPYYINACLPSGEAPTLATRSGRIPWGALAQHLRLPGVGIAGTLGVSPTWRDAREEWVSSFLACTLRTPDPEALAPILIDLASRGVPAYATRSVTSPGCRVYCFLSHPLPAARAVELAAALATWFGRHGHARDATCPTDPAGVGGMILLPYRGAVVRSSGYPPLFGVTHGRLAPASLLEPHQRATAGALMRLATDAPTRPEAASSPNAAVGGGFRRPTRPPTPAHPPRSSRGMRRGMRFVGGSAEHPCFSHSALGKGPGRALQALCEAGRPMEMKDWATRAGVSLASIYRYRAVLLEHHLIEPSGGRWMAASGLPERLDASAGVRLERSTAGGCE